MTTDPLLLTGEVDEASARLLRTAATFDPADVTADSLLPGWTRGHLLTHLARNADGLVNLLTAARTGEHLPMYASPEARHADIEAGAGRGPAEQVADLRAAGERFAAAVAAMPVAAWGAQVRTHRGTQPAALLVWFRLRELEVHHVDLRTGYRPADWSPAFAQRLLHEVVARLRGLEQHPDLVLRAAEGGPELPVGDPERAPVIRGTAHDLAAWLIGRSDGADLARTPEGPLPTPPEWI